MNWVKARRIVVAVAAYLLAPVVVAGDQPVTWADITQGATLPVAELEETKALFAAGKIEEARAIVVQYETQRMHTLQAEWAAFRVKEATAALAEEKRLQARPYDCLAGLCLNTKLSHSTKGVATVAEHKWQRDVEVCSGRVVDITLLAVWVSSEVTVVGMLPQAVTKVYTDGYDAVATLMRVQTGLHTKGWSDKNTTGAAFPEQADYNNINIRGQRTLLYDKTTDYTGTMWSIMLYTRHEDYASLCAAKKSQGL